MAVLKIKQGEITRELEFLPPKPLALLLQEAGIAVRHPCGGRGSCGKCRVELMGEVSAANKDEKLAGARLSCQAVILGDAQVTLGEPDSISQIEMDSAATIKAVNPMDGKVGAAVDIGTTTIALRLYDLISGELLSESAMENPQTAVAADIMGRIGAAMEGKLSVLQTQVRSAVKELLVKAGGDADVMVITGNTTMLYLLTGRDTTCLSAYPFKADTLFDTEIQLDGIPAYLPPCMNAFVGADITCAVLASEMCSDKIALLCDIGTNGELALWKDGILYVTSTAAGPAFEGAGISCGCSSIPGAIDRVWENDGEVHVHTIDDVSAVGVCGSGLIDAAAILLELELMDETGAMDDDLELAPGVVLLQKDIRAVQLAKAAIAAGIKTLLEASETELDQIEKFYIAGGFGSHINIASAARIGLIPDELTDRVEVLGNAALAGASSILLNRGNFREIRRIAGMSRHWDLGGNPNFNTHYMDAILFPFNM